MVAASEIISRPRSRQRFLRTGLRGFRAGAADQRSLITDHYENAEVGSEKLEANGIAALPCSNSQLLTSNSSLSHDYKRLLCETDNVGGAISHTYASDTTEEFGDLIGEDGQYIHQYDAQANTNALLDETGAVAAQYKYLAFGQVNAVSIDGGPWTAEDWESLPLDFTSNMLAGGKKQYYLDQETALYLLGSGNNGRYYDAATGRFLSEDPTGEAGGDDNLFRYTGNDPVNNLDPSGHDTKKDPPKPVYHPPQNQQTQQHNPKQQTQTAHRQMVAPTHPSASESALTQTATNAGVSASNAVSSTISTKGISDLTSGIAQTLHEISPKPALPALPISKDGQTYNPKPETVYTLGNDSKVIAAHNKLVDEALAGKSVDFSKDPYGFQHVQAVIEKEPSTGGLVGEGISFSTPANDLVGAVIGKIGETVAPAIKGIAGKIAGGVGEKVAGLISKATEAIGKLFGKTDGKGIADTTERSVADKLQRYLLNPDHPEGGAKAVQTEVTKYGTKFNQIIEVVGANGRTIPIKTAWIRNTDGVVRLVTAFPGD